MDFPYNLSSGEFVEGLDEFKQSLSLILTNYIGSFYQSSTLGAYFDVHVDASSLKVAVKKTCEELSSVLVDSVDVSPLGEVTVNLHYKGKFVNYKFMFNENN